jgi:hypothetical protein
MEDESNVMLAEAKIEISRNELRERKMTKNHALTLVESTGNELTTEALAMKKLHELNQVKWQIKKKAKNTIHSIMLKKASELEMKYQDSNGNLIPVSSCKDIGLSWKQDPCRSNAEKMFDIMYGQFEKNSIYWREIMEKEIMDELNLKYIDNTTFRNKESGCVSKIITTAKMEIIKNINRAGLLQHGKTIVLSNPRGTGKKRKRRNPGVFMDCFVRSTGKTETSISEVEVRMSRLLLNMLFNFHMFTYCFCFSKHSCVEKDSSEPVNKDCSIACEFDDYSDDTSDEADMIQKEVRDTG